MSNVSNWCYVCVGSLGMVPPQGSDVILIVMLQLIKPIIRLCIFSKTKAIEKKRHKNKLAIEIIRLKVVPGERNDKHPLRYHRLLSSLLRGDFANIGIISSTTIFSL